MRLLSLCLVVILLQISCSKTPGPHERLNGTWQSDLMTVTIDFAGGRYSGVAFGQPFSKRLTLVSEYANVVTFKSDETAIVCQIQSDDRILLTKEGGIPVLFTRAN
jgi:hypothetical protein